MSEKNSPNRTPNEIPNEASDEAPDTFITLIVERERPKVKPPKLYKVVLLNDDYTPMEFVVELLEKFFHMPHAKATDIMLQVHHHGKGVCGIFTHEIAETKVTQVNQYSKSNQHPLMCIMEEA